MYARIYLYYICKVLAYVRVREAEAPPGENRNSMHRLSYHPTQADGIGNAGRSYTCSRVSVARLLSCALWGPAQGKLERARRGANDVDHLLHASA